jgi:hypothetical protein
MESGMEFDEARCTNINSVSIEVVFLRLMAACKYAIKNDIENIVKTPIVIFTTHLFSYTSILH